MPGAGEGAGWELALHGPLNASLLLVWTHMLSCPCGGRPGVSGSLAIGQRAGRWPELLSQQGQELKPEPARHCRWSQLSPRSLDGSCQDPTAADSVISLLKLLAQVYPMHMMSTPPEGLGASH